MTTIIPLYDALDAANVGGKAVSLGSLLRSGFNVPPGYVIAGGEASESEILDVFDKLNASLVAVRSSAISEDGNVASWAGQFETYLNVARSELRARIKDCVASAASLRAIAYSKQAGHAGEVSVIIQAMVASEVSGVGFSVQPVSQDHNQVVIEAVAGLGEALVSGETTPDTYVLQKNAKTIISKTINPRGSIQKLSDVQIKELSDTIIQLEILYGLPVDVEWAWAHEQFYVLQCRPVTGLN